MFTMSRESEMNLVKCNKCKWVHMELTPDKASEIPTGCFRCGNTYKDFSPAEDKDCPNGSTVQAILKKPKISVKESVELLLEKINKMTDEEVCKLFDDKEVKPEDAELYAFLDKSIRRTK